MIPCRVVGSWCRLGTLAFCLCLAAQAAAQDEAPSYRFELTPMAAYRIGGRFEEKDGDARFDLTDSDARGLVFDIDARNGGQWEVLYAYQDTTVRTQGLLSSSPLLDLHVEYLHFGGTYPIGDSEPYPFLAFSIGFSRFDPTPSELTAESYGSASIGVGVQLRQDKRLGVRIEGRVFTTFIDSDSDVFCRVSGAVNRCAVRVDGTALTQTELRAGLVYRF